MPDINRNKQNVLAFYDLMFNQCRPREAIERYAGAHYTQHNPGVADGKEGFIAYFEEAAREIAEEIAVTDLLRSDSFAIGLAYDPVFCHPELFLLAPSRATAADILDGARHAPDRNEAAGLFSLPLSDLLNEAGLPEHTPRTWSFLKGQGFLRQHFRERHAL